jgi:hypothetical protein
VGCQGCGGGNSCGCGCYRAGFAAVAVTLEGVVSMGVEVSSLSFGCEVEPPSSTCVSARASGARSSSADARAARAAGRGTGCKGVGGTDSAASMPVVVAALAVPAGVPRFHASSAST